MSYCNSDLVEGFAALPFANYAKLRVPYLMKNRNSKIWHIDEQLKRNRDLLEKNKQLSLECCRLKKEKLVQEIELKREIEDMHCFVIYHEMNMWHKKRALDHRFILSQTARKSLEKECVRLKKIIHELRVKNNEFQTFISTQFLDTLAEVREEYEKT